MEKKNLKYFAAICFAILAVFAIISCFKYFSFLNLIQVVAYILIAVALLIDKSVFSIVGFAALAILNLYNLVNWFRAVIEWDLPFNVLLATIVLLAVNILLLIASVTPKSAKNLGLIAAIVSVVRFIIVIIQNRKNHASEIVP